MEAPVESKQQRAVPPGPHDEPRARGTVQHTYPERGFGFIRCTEGAEADIGDAFFFHQSGLEDGLQVGDLLPGTLVEFEPTEVPRGKRAEHVQRVL